MSPVLRKKIDAANGIPPTLLSNEDFWTKLDQSVSEWTLETFDCKADPILTDRRMIWGKAIPDFCGDGVLFSFGSHTASGVKGIIFKNTFALLNASKRLGISIAEAGQTSPLFLRLVGEDCALALYRHLSICLAGPRESGDGEASLSDNNFEPDDRILAVGISFSLGDQACEIIILMSQEFTTSKAQGPHLDIPSRAFQESHQAVRDSIRFSEVAVDAVMDKLFMSVGECLRLEVGQVVPLLTGGINSIDLIARTITGDWQIAQGEMGVWRHNRALKLSTPISENFIQDFAA